MKRQAYGWAGLVVIASLAAQPQSNGFALAIAILIGMAAALIWAGVTWLRAWQSDFANSPWQPAWLDALMLVLTIIGLAVAGYLTYVETQAVAAVCGPVGDCNAVQTSSYSRLFGLIPVGLIGMAGYGRSWPCGYGGALVGRRPITLTGRARMTIGRGFRST
jgi:uncharacterized membrane protein